MISKTPLAPLLFASLFAITVMAPAPLARADQDDKDLVHLVPKAGVKAWHGFRWLGRKIVGDGTVKPGTPATLARKPVAPDPVPPPPPQPQATTETPPPPPPQPTVETPPPPPPPQPQAATTSASTYAKSECQFGNWRTQNGVGCEGVDYTTTVTSMGRTAVKYLVDGLAKVGLTNASQNVAGSTIGTQALAGLTEAELAPLAKVQQQVTAKIRAGYIPEANPAACKGNILFLQGLSDSIQNHLPLFNTLSDAGYRVIAFDYMGQGGSDGDSNNNRIENIPELGERIYRRYRSARCPKKILMGWSAGGLAAYYWAADRLSDYIPGFEPKPEAKNEDINAVILIAPILAMKTFPGTTKFPFTFAQISIDQWTKATPDLKDPINPTTVALVPAFGVDMVINSFLSRSVRIVNPPAFAAKYVSPKRIGAWTIPSRIKGTILVAGNQDVFANSEATMAEISRMAPHFAAYAYKDQEALHALDMERPGIADDVRSRVLSFLKSLE